jgi:hypothetical protein
VPTQEDEEVWSVELTPLSGRKFETKEELEQEVTLGDLRVFLVNCGKYHDRVTTYKIHFVGGNTMGRSVGGG